MTGLANDTKHTWDESTRKIREQADNIEWAKNTQEVLDIFKSGEPLPEWILKKFERWASSFHPDYTADTLIKKSQSGTEDEKRFLARVIAKDPTKQTTDEVKQRRLANSILEQHGYRLEALPKLGEGSYFVDKGCLKKHLTNANEGEKNSLDSRVVRLDNADWWPIVLLESKFSRGTGGSQRDLMIVIESLLKEACGIKEAYIGVQADVEQAYTGKLTFDYLNKKICDDRTFIVDTLHLYEVLQKIENKHKPT